MPREDFISDNLYSMRDRLKRNYERLQQERDGVGNETPAPEQSTPLKNSAETAVIRDESVRKECRELEGRILRDLAFIESELQRLTQQSEAATQFQQLLQKEAAALHTLSETPAAKAGELNRISREYFSAYGKFNSLLRSSGELPVNSTVTQNHNRCGGSNLLQAAATIIAALIMALTLIFIFG